MNWIRLEDGLPEKPEVLAIARALQACAAPPGAVLGNAVLGALVRVWLWADRNTETGFVPGATLDDVDRVALQQGFGALMVQCGWLVHNPVDNPVGILFTNFQRHNGHSAKRRALHARAQEKYRNKKPKGRA